MRRHAFSECLPPPPLAQLRDVALFLDLDGTLAPFADSPDAVGPDAARNALLSRLDKRLQGRLAIVSGRTIADIDRILEHSVIAVAGGHGLERRTVHGHRITPPVHPQLGAAYVALSEFAAAAPGVLVENKGYSIALHYRGAPAAEQPARALARRLETQTGLALQEGAMVVELRSPGSDKGDAIGAFMRESPFKGANPVFIGDDLTDESGFAAVEALGGHAILAGALRATCAMWRLDDVRAVRNWLERGAP